jgi:hypothetical protein
VRRDGGWDKPDLIEPRVLTGALGQDEMAHVNRIKRPPQNAKFHQTSDFRLQTSDFSKNFFLMSEV